MEHGTDKNGLFHVQKIDIDNDGSPELLIDFPVGAHGANLKVYKYHPTNGMVELDTLAADCGPYFEINDFDNDGKLEVATFHRNYSGDPVGDPPIRRIFRMVKGKFKEVSI